MDDPVWDHSTFSKNRDRLLDGEIAAKFLTAVLAQPRVKRLLSSERYSIDGTLIEARASMKSFKPEEPPEGGGGAADGGRNAPVDFRGEKWSRRKIFLCWYACSRYRDARQPAATSVRPYLRPGFT